MKKLLLVFWISCLPVSAAAAPDFAKLNAALTQNIAVPGYLRLVQDMRGLHRVTGQFCAAGEKGDRRKVTAAFVRATHAWQRISVITFGPVSDDSGALRVYFWPERRDAVDKRLRRALAAKDPGLLRPGGLKQTSVALQSLAAFERLLTGKNLTGYSCELMTGIAAFQAGLAEEFSRGWARPGAIVGTPSEIATKFLTSMVAALDLIIRRKIEAPLGSDEKTAFPRRSENWRTGRSADNIVDNLETLRRMITVRDGFGDRLAENKGAALAAAIDSRLESIQKQLSGLPTPLPDAILKPVQRKEVEKILEELRQTRFLVRNSVAEALGLTIGFNSLDGD